jgi:K+-transporting ATPase ATPase C chain
VIKVGGFLKTQLGASIIMLAALSILTGILYPLIITGAAQGLFRHGANGSLIVRDEQTVGSALIGQSFEDPKYFWSRPSATSPMPYNASASSGSNLGPLNSDLTDLAQSRIDALRNADPDNTQPIPIDLVTASASGLDPHISVAAARYQISRIARVRGLTIDEVGGLVDDYTEGRHFGLLGESRVNVLKLNLALDSYKIDEANN